MEYHLNNTSCKIIKLIYLGFGFSVFSITENKFQHSYVLLTFILMSIYTYFLTNHNYVNPETEGKISQQDDFMVSFVQFLSYTEDATAVIIFMSENILYRSYKLKVYKNIMDLKKKRRFMKLICENKCLYAVIFMVVSMAVIQSYNCIIWDDGFRVRLFIYLKQTIMTLMFCKMASESIIVVLFLKKFNEELKICESDAEVKNVMADYDKLYEVSDYISKHSGFAVIIRRLK